MHLSRYQLCYMWCYTIHQKRSANATSNTQVCLWILCYPRQVFKIVYCAGCFCVEVLDLDVDTHREFHVHHDRLIVSVSWCIFNAMWFWKILWLIGQYGSIRHGFTCSQIMQSFFAICLTLHYYRQWTWLRFSLFLAPMLQASSYL